MEPKAMKCRFHDAHRLADRYFRICPALAPLTSMRAELPERFRSQLGPPFPASAMKAAFRAAALRLTQLMPLPERGAVLVLDRLSGEQMTHSYASVHGEDEINKLFTWRIPQQIHVSCAQVAALAFLAGDLQCDVEWERCPNLVLPTADDLLLEWSGPEIEAYAYVFAADSTGRSLIARAPVMGMLTGTFRVERRQELLKPLMPVYLTEALRLSAMYCWPG
jgi:hypothetical protein